MDWALAPGNRGQRSAARGGLPVLALVLPLRPEQRKWARFALEGGRGGDPAKRAAPRRLPPKDDETRGGENGAGKLNAPGAFRSAGKRWARRSVAYLRACWYNGLKGRVVVLQAAGFSERTEGR